MKRKTAKRMVSWILSIIMILSCASASFGVIASAAEWQHIDGVTYDPITLYVQASSLTAGKTYLIAFGNNYPNRVINGVNNQVTTTEVTRIASGNTGYYTSDDGKDNAYNASNYYVVDESNNAYVNNEFVWQNSALYNSANKKYFVIDGTSGVQFRCPPHQTHGHTATMCCPRVSEAVGLAVQTIMLQITVLLLQ